MTTQKLSRKSSLKKVQGQFENWHNTWKSRCPIPEALWDAKRKGVTPILFALTSYDKL